MADGQSATGADKLITFGSLSSQLRVLENFMGEAENAIYDTADRVRFHLDSRPDLKAEKSPKMIPPGLSKLSMPAEYSNRLIQLSDRLKRLKQHSENVNAYIGLDPDHEPDAIDKPDAFTESPHR